MAERITPLGGTACGTVRDAGKKIALQPWPVGIYQVNDQLRVLIDRYATLVNAIRSNIEEVDEAGDSDTADLFTEVSRWIDKQSWFLAVHIQERSPSESCLTPE